MANYTGNSIVDYLGSVGQASDFASRSKLAAAQGITGYTGSADQNTTLLNKLRTPPSATNTVSSNPNVLTLPGSAVPSKPAGGGIFTPYTSSIPGTTMNTQPNLGQTMGMQSAAASGALPASSTLYGNAPTTQGMVSQASSAAQGAEQKILDWAAANSGFVGNWKDAAKFYGLTGNESLAEQAAAVAKRFAGNQQVPSFVTGYSATPSGVAQQYKSQAAPAPQTPSTTPPVYSSSAAAQDYTKVTQGVSATTNGYQTGAAAANENPASKTPAGTISNPIKGLVTADSATNTQLKTLSDTIDQFTKAGKALPAGFLEQANNLASAVAIANQNAQQSNTAAQKAIDAGKASSAKALKEESVQWDSARDKSVQDLMTLYANNYNALQNAVQKTGAEKDTEVALGALKDVHDKTINNAMTRGVVAGNLGALEAEANRQYDSATAPLQRQLALAQQDRSILTNLYKDNMSSLTTAMNQINALQDDQRAVLKDVLSMAENIDMTSDVQDGIVEVAKAAGISPALALSAAKGAREYRLIQQAKGSGGSSSGTAGGAGSTAAQVKALGIKDAKVAELTDKAKLIDSLSNHEGLDSRVGPNTFARTGFADLFGAGQDFAAGVHELVSKDTLNTLINLKSQGGTLGALSDQERIMLQNAATKISSWEVLDSKGVGKGEWNIDEDSFKAELNQLKMLTKRALVNNLGYDPTLVSPDDVSDVNEVYGINQEFNPASFY